MKIYLVGGAVRDELLNRPVVEHDYVVVGATPQEMESLGYLPVGKDFPVFLHPETKDEHALARTERKSGRGYKGFTVNADASVTLEEDLLRRDLTVNAIAKMDDGSLVDPYNGVADIEAKKLRHVSDAFREDPVRILRIARFMARYASYGFSIADETLDLMKSMVNDGEVDYLVPERVWAETEKALKETSPWEYFLALRACGALGRIMPELDALFGVPQNPEYHPEIDTGEHIMLVLKQAVKLGGSPQVIFASALHDLGKAQTPKDQLPHHPNHDVKSAELAKVLCQRIKAPNDYRDLAVLVAANHTKCHQLDKATAEDVVALLENLDAKRKPERVADFCLACEADSKGRPGFEDKEYTRTEILLKSLSAIQALDDGAIAKAQENPKGIKAAIRAARIAAVKAVLEQP